jgi:hypothetical protein
MIFGKGGIIFFPISMRTQSCHPAGVTIVSPLWGYDRVSSTRLWSCHLYEVMIVSPLRGYDHATPTWYISLTPLLVTIVSPRWGFPVFHVPFGYNRITSTRL